MLWMDYLGLAAQLKVGLVSRYYLFNKHRGLIDTSDFTPNPEYCVSILHKRLVGAKVLAPSDTLEIGRTVRSYAHCT